MFGTPQCDATFLICPLPSPYHLMCIYIRILKEKSNLLLILLHGVHRVSYREWCEDSQLRVTFLFLNNYFHIYNLLHISYRNVHYHIKHVILHCNILWFECLYFKVLCYTLRKVSKSLIKSYYFYWIIIWKLDCDYCMFYNIILMGISINRNISYLHNSMIQDTDNTVYI